VHLVSFTIELYYDTRSYKRHIPLSPANVAHETYIFRQNNKHVLLQLSLDNLRHLLRRQDLTYLGQYLCTTTIRYNTTENNISSMAQDTTAHKRNVF
jgi:adenine C2-methylase RlmN of 23S rRNA A2503 and tRNA A37